MRLQARHRGADMRRDQPRPRHSLQHGQHLLQVRVLRQSPNQHLSASRFSHDSPFYLPHRGGCVCYSGDFICSKEDYTKAFKKDEIPVGNNLKGMTINTFKILLPSPAPVRGRVPVPGLQQEGLQGCHGREEGGGCQDVGHPRLLTKLLR